MENVTHIKSRLTINVVTSLKIKKKHCQCEYKKR